MRVSFGVSVVFAFALGGCGGSSPPRVDSAPAPDAGADAPVSDGASPDTAPPADRPPDAPPPACPAGARRCNAAEGTSESCQEGRWMTDQHCPFLCTDGMCTGDCLPGQRDCMDLVPRTCNQDGHWQSGVACENACSAGVCTGACTEGRRQCGADQVPQSCAGGAWISGERCPYVCTGLGECGGVCPPGQTRCSGTEAQTCDGSGHWRASAGDCLAPLVVQISPTDAQTGVRADARLVITFSEPMNAAATEAAFSSTDLPAHSFSWDDGGQVLTVIPTGGLAYAGGTNLSVSARRYSFVIGNGAADRAGNKLAQPFLAQFSTFRQLDFSAVASAPLSGSLSDNGDVGIGDGFVYTNCLGTTYDSEARAFLTFDIAALPAGISEIESATLTLNAFALDASQMFPTAPVAVSQVHFAALDLDTYMAAAAAELGTLSPDGDVWTITGAAFRDGLAGDYANRGSNGNRAQYRIRVQADTCEQRASFHLDANAPDEAPKLAVRYLIP